MRKASAAPNLMPEESKPRGDAADALWHHMVLAVTTKR
jgi:hypothetical protein